MKRKVLVLCAAVSVLFIGCPICIFPTNEFNGVSLVVENKSSKNICLSMEQDFFSVYVRANSTNEEMVSWESKSAEWTDKGPIDFYEGIIHDNDDNTKTRELGGFITRIDDADSVITLSQDDRDDDGYGLLTYKIVITDAMLEQKTTGVLLVIENESSQDLCLSMEGSFSAAHVEKKEGTVSMNKSVARISGVGAPIEWTDKGPIDFYESIYINTSTRKWKKKGDFIMRSNNANSVITLLENAKDAGGYGLLIYKFVVTDAMLSGGI